MIVISTLMMLAGLLAIVPAAADDLSTPVNISPINSTFTIEPGPTSYFKDTKIDTLSLYDARYKLKSVSIMDITVSTLGPDLGTINGTVKVNGVTLFTYDGKWSEFNTAQSLLTSKLVKKNQAGVNALMHALTRREPVVLSVSGVVGKAPAAKNANSITVYAPMQASGIL